MLCCIIVSPERCALCCIIGSPAVRCVVSLAVRLCAVLYHCQPGTLCAVLYHWRSGCVLCCITGGPAVCCVVSLAVRLSAVLYHWRSGTLWPSGTLGLASPLGQAGSHSLLLLFPFHYPVRECFTAARTYFRNLKICPTLGCHPGNCHCCFCCPGSLLSSV